MTKEREQAAGILRRAHEKYTSDLFSLEVLIDVDDEPTLRIIRFEDGQLRDVMERRQAIIPNGMSPNDLRYAAFVFGMARASVELVEQDDYQLWFDDIVCIDLLRLDSLMSEDDFYEATKDVEGARLSALAVGSAEDAAERFKLPLLEDPADQRELYILWDRTATLAGIWDYATIIRMIGEKPKPQLFDYLLAILNENLEYPDGWYPSETFEEGISGPRIFAAIARDSVRPSMSEEQQQKLDAIVEEMGWLPPIEHLETLERQAT